MKPFSSVWLLHTLVKGNFILIWVDHKSVKVITMYQKEPHKVWDTASLALQLIKSMAADNCLLFVPREHGDLQAVTTLTNTSPCHLPSALRDVPSTGEKPHSTKKVKMSTKTHSCFSWRDTCDSRKADQLACWVLSRPLPPQNTKLSVFKAAFHYQRSHTHQNNLFTKTYLNRQFWALKMNQLRRNKSNRDYYSYSLPEKVLRQGW